MKLFTSTAAVAGLAALSSAAAAKDELFPGRDDKSAIIAARQGRVLNYIGRVGTLEPLSQRAQDAALPVVVDAEVLDAAVAVAGPASGSLREGRGQGHCVTKQETVYTQECRTAYDQQCHQDYQTVFKTDYDQKCDTVYETVCHPVPKSVPEQQCITFHDEVCTKETQETVETRTEQRCHVNTHEECTTVDEVVSHQALTKKKPKYKPSYYHGYRGRYGYGYQQPKGSAHGVYGRQGYGGHSAYGVHPGGGRSFQSFKLGRGKREAEPSYYDYGVEYVTEVASKPVCRTVEEQVCEEVPISVPKFFEVPKCEQVPRIECRESQKQVLDTKCDQVPRQMCTKVPRQVTDQVPFQVCEDIPREECQQVPRKVPREICEEYLD